ncbi:uncharacterized protein BO88DRAFT_450877 [Aspergillus vadensis CBS 113365]|uniref:Uncharacterized protein n=1 Tax=Aspergillus vadensis (strain CBS 113365 / IMI 142717 / IBT 24658) TaxID=1448311 RepID=A0A319C220_ASPVC|nr:hypothetical protein BO88DRAFT_450877 [Aspergillus vadensis CBS 113365]PYH72273.1 hypothetical protein BO88DRAFT_450877 [Aspergillus vadensis CBS 113365]
MSLITPPPITIEDLHAFQAKHFPGSVIAQTPQPQNVTNTNISEEYTLEEEEYEYYDEEEDLGYYPDGVKRTLTDEQIRIFRHSEIHALRREKELREEEAADAAAAAAADRAVAANADANAKTDAVGTEQASKSRAEGEEDVDVKMDYGEGEGGASASKATSKTTSRPVPQFTGRRIISYDD